LLQPDVVLDEMSSFADSPVFDELLYHLAYGEEQKGTTRNSITKPLVIGWGRRDLVCFPGQARRALAKFPDAQLYWFDRCGHFPQWDRPEEIVRLILDATSQNEIAETRGIYDDSTETKRINFRFR
jgi:pimeloyl-ACP methyl ester carboxylesterase